jgi:hypothetical protein
MPDRTGLGGPLAAGDFASINGLWHDAYREGATGKWVWRPRAFTAPLTSDKADRMRGVHNLGTVSGAIVIDFNDGPSGNKRWVCSGPVSITFAGGVSVGTFLLLITANSHPVTFPPGTRFENGAAPDLSGAGERAVPVVYTGT